MIRTTATVFSLWCALAWGGADSQEPWVKQMQDLSRVLPEMLYDTSNSRRYNDPKNRARIEQNAKFLAEVAHGMRKHEKDQKSKDPKKKALGPNDTDPSLWLIAERFEDQATHAYQTLKSGYREYARGVLQTLPTYCIACHTRTDYGPDFPKLNIPIPEGLTAMERANLFAATRQYDRALAEFKNVIRSPEVSQKDLIQWERAVRKSLSISIRVKHNPAQALAVVDDALSVKTGPVFFREELKNWRQAIVRWNREPKRKQKTVRGYLSEAKLLISKARKVQKYPADTAGEIYYMRSSAVLHELMRQKLTPSEMAQALFLTGLSYEALQNLSPWLDPEIYFESCIRHHPHSEEAEECFKRYKADVQMGYSGSSGTHLPPSVAVRLQKLRDMALRKKKKS